MSNGNLGEAGLLEGCFFHRTGTVLQYRCDKTKVNTT